MRRITVLLLVLMVVTATSAFAQFRIDIGFNAPIAVGVESVNSPSGEPFKIPSFIPLPFAQASYAFNLGPLTMGLGLKAYTLIIESIAWPTAYVELAFDPFLVSLSGGGGYLFYFGVLGNGSLDTHVFMPDLAAEVKLGRFARLGLGIMTFVGFEGQESFPYLFYGSLHFAFPL